MDWGPDVPLQRGIHKLFISAHVAFIADLRPSPYSCQSTGPEVIGPLGEMTMYMP